jgi:hypothetical protein
MADDRQDPPGAEPTARQLRATLAELDARAERLAERLGAGDTTVRNELNEAIRSSRQVSEMLHRLEPPEPRPAPMYGPPPLRPPLGEMGTTMMDVLRRIFRRTR